MNEWKRDGVVWLIALSFILGISLLQSHEGFWGSATIFFCVLAIIKIVPWYHGKQQGCYRIRIRIKPKWEEIVPHVPKDIKYPEIFFKKIVNDPELEIDKDDSLVGKIFQYTVFVDESSGMKQIYSLHDKAFVDEMKESGWILNSFGNEKAFEKYGIPENLSDTELEITPFGIGKLTRDPIMAEYSDVEEGDWMSNIPISDIIHHLKRLSSVWSAMRGILEFPKELKEKLDKYKVKYETRNHIDTDEWYGTPISKDCQKYPKKVGFVLSNDTMWWQTFSTKYLEVSVNLKKLKPSSCEDILFDE